MSFKLFTDTSANLPVELVAKYDIGVIPFTFTVDGDESFCMDPMAFDGVGFYDAMRNGAEVNTSQVPPQRYVDNYTPFLEAGQDILFVSMSSGISGSFNSSLLALDLLKDRFPERTICSIDTLGASLGEGLPVLWAAEYREQGKSIEETVDLLTVRCFSMCQIFTVDDLKYLRRTGRLSNAAAVIGQMLGIKPILKGNEEGQIICIAKLRGRMKAINQLVDKYKENVVAPEEQVIGIAHADCKNDALKLAEKLNAAAKPKDILIVDYEPVTGSHVGPGALALFFEGHKGVRSL